ncbi:MAG: chemotaxis protein CheX [Planctomycetota bacterium]|nr:chemotaxis protein CheX [Planctomycetota bacterium]
MKSLDLEILQNLTQDILGKMAFMFVEPVAEVGGLEDSLSACVEYVGPGGTDALILQGSADFLMELASGLLGLEFDEVDKNVEGMHSLKEIANVLAGEIIRELGGEHAQFTLGIPYVLEGPSPEGANGSVVCDFDAMGQAFRASVVHLPNA